jgi:arsenite oxidase large subunit
VISPRELSKNCWRTTVAEPIWENASETALVGDHGRLFRPRSGRLERTKTNYFLNHWIPNLRGTSNDKKKAEFGSEPIEPVSIIFVDPRRTVTINACEIEAGKDRVMHLAINPGTDLALFNAWLTLVADKGWTDKAFISGSTTNFDKALGANRTSLDEAARITGLTIDQITKSAAWIAESKQGGARRRTMFAYEKGLIWGNDNYRTNGALVNVALATGNIGRPGGGCVRMGGHQEGYSRPSDAFIGRPAPRFVRRT